MMTSHTTSRVTGEASFSFLTGTHRSEVAPSDVSGFTFHVVRLMFHDHLLEDWAAGQ